MRLGGWGRDGLLAGVGEHPRRARARSLIPLLLLLLLAGPAHAGQPSEDTLRAGQVQVQADEAFRAGDYEEALTLAGRAIGLDPGATTWLAQQIRIEVLERQGEHVEAMEHLRAYLALEGLFPEHKAWGQEAEERIGAVLREQQEREQRLIQRVQGRRGAGIGLMIGGAVPLGIGVGFAINFGYNDGDVERYGGWLDSGLVLMGVGAALEVFGLVLVLTAEEPQTGGVALGPAPGGLVLRGTFR